MWEASASLARRPGDPWKIANVPASHGRVLVAHVEALVAGVGDHERGYWHTDSVSVHYRCPLTDGEVAQLDAAWCALPAVHTGGNEDRMTREPPWS